MFRDSESPHRYMVPIFSIACGNFASRHFVVGDRLNRLVFCLAHLWFRIRPKKQIVGQWCSLFDGDLANTRRLTRVDLSKCRVSNVQIKCENCVQRGSEGLKKANGWRPQSTCADERTSKKSGTMKLNNPARCPCFLVCLWGFQMA